MSVSNPPGEWFANWFDSPYYHILYKHRDTKEAHLLLNNLLGFLKPLPDSKILDLACGRGRHAVYLNNKGFDVTGIDLSQSSIRYASQYEQKKLSFHVHDMRKVFKKNEFDLVLNLFTSFGYFENKNDDCKVLEAISNALKPNGILVLDFLNMNKATATLPLEEIKTVEHIVFRIRKFVEDNMLVKQINFIDNGKEFSFEEKVRTYTLADFNKLLASCQFTITDTFGDYRLNPFHENAERLIVVAKK